MTLLKRLLCGIGIGAAIGVAICVVAGCSAELQCAGELCMACVDCGNMIEHCENASNVMENGNGIRENFNYVMLMAVMIALGTIGGVIWGISQTIEERNEDEYQKWLKKQKKERQEAEKRCNELRRKAQNLKNDVELFLENGFDAEKTIDYEYDKKKNEIENMMKEYRKGINLAETTYEWMMNMVGGNSNGNKL